jgi:hypothetical protein
MHASQVKTSSQHSLRRFLAEHIPLIRKTDAPPEQILAARHNRDMDTFLREPFGDGTAYALTRTGYDGGLAGELKVHRTFSP